MLINIRQVSSKNKNLSIFIDKFDRAIFYYNKQNGKISIHTFKKNGIIEDYEEELILREIKKRVEKEVTQ